MTTETQIDFSTYTDRQLEASLSAINRDKFAENYQNCRAEIDKRKANGTWDATLDQEKKQSFLKARRWAMLSAKLQFVGGLLGVIRILYDDGPKVLAGEFSLINIVILGLLTFLFGATAWFAGHYIKTEKDSGGWRILLGLQIPAFKIASLGYQFFCGMSLPVGYVLGEFRVGARLTAEAALLWNPQTVPFTLTINFVPILILGFLNRAHSEIAMSEKAANETPTSVL